MCRNARATMLILCLSLCYQCSHFERGKNVHSSNRKKRQIKKEQTYTPKNTNQIKEKHVLWIQMYTENNIWSIPSSTQNQLTWIQIDEQKKIENETNQTNSSHTQILTKYSPGNSSNGDVDDDANSITRTNRKKAFRSELIGKITVNWVCFSCSCPRYFLHHSLSRMPESIFFPFERVCVSSAGALKV